MIVLPKFLYLFVTILIPLTQAFFNSLWSSLIALVWAGKQPRVSWDLLTRPLSQGGLGAPDLELYALCAQAQFLHFWIHPIQFQPHVAIKKDVADPIPLHAAIYKPYHWTTGEVNTVKSLRWAWEGLRKRVGTPLLYAPSTPLAHHPLFPILQDKGTIERARSMGLSKLGDLYPQDTFLRALQNQDGSPTPILELLLYY